MIPGSRECLSASQVYHPRPHPKSHGDVLTVPTEHGLTSHSTCCSALLCCTWYMIPDTTTVPYRAHIYSIIVQGISNYLCTDLVRRPRGLLGCAVSNTPISSIGVIDRRGVGFVRPFYHSYHIIIILNSRQTSWSECSIFLFRALAPHEHCYSLEAKRGAACINTIDVSRKFVS